MMNYNMEEVTKAEFKTHLQSLVEFGKISDLTYLYQISKNTIISSKIEGALANAISNLHFVSNKDKDIDVLELPAQIRVQFIAKLGESGWVESLINILKRDIQIDLKRESQNALIEALVWASKNGMDEQIKKIAYEPLVPIQIRTEAALWLIDNGFVIDQQKMDGIHINSPIVETSRRIIERYIEQIKNSTTQLELKLRNQEKRITERKKITS